MTLRHLQIFVAVAEQGKMRSAAKELYIAQPAVSQAVAEIEQHYNLKLFERLSRKLYITPDGELLLSYAKHILSMFDEMEQAMNKTMEHATLKVGATITVGTCILNHLLKEYRGLYPNADVQVYIGTLDFLEEGICRNELDIALVENIPKHPELIFEPFLDDSMILVCSPEHPFAETGYASLEDISKANYIAREIGGNREIFADIMERHNYPLKSKWFCNNSETTKQAVHDNYGVTVISKRIVQKELLNGTLIEVSVPELPITRKFQMLYHKSKYFSDPLRDFADQCRALEVTLLC